MPKLYWGLSSSGCADKAGGKAQAKTRGEPSHELKTCSRKMQAAQVNVKCQGATAQWLTGHAGGNWPGVNKIAPPGVVRLYHQVRLGPGNAWHRIGAQRMQRENHKVHQSVATVQQPQQAACNASGAQHERSHTAAHTTCVSPLCPSQLPCWLSTHQHAQERAHAAPAAPL